MAAGTEVVTKLMDRVKALADLVSGITASFQGYKVFSAAANENDDIRALTAQTQGHFNFDLVKRTIGRVTESGSVSIVGELKIKLAKDTTTDINSGYELAEALLQKLTLQSNLSGSGYAAQVESGSYTVREPDRKSGILFFDFELAYRLGPIC